jgi:DNA repair protein RadC
MARHIFQSETELQNIPEAAPEVSRSFSVSEKLARYGFYALSGVEHLTLLVGKESVALALIRHFGSLKGMARASFQELRQFLPRRQAESVVAALSMYCHCGDRARPFRAARQPRINSGRLR